jgi:hypothetical protein
MVPSIYIIAFWNETLGGLIDTYILEKSGAIISGVNLDSIYL